jgi:hypothetical protein
VVLETDPSPEEHEPFQAFDVNRTGRSELTANGVHDFLDVDEDKAPPAPRLSSPILSPPPSGLTTLFHLHPRRGRTTPPSSPRIKREHTTPPPPHIRRERTIPPSSPRSRTMRATPSSRLTAPSSPRSEVNTDLLPRPQKRTKLPTAPFCQGCTPGPKPKASDYEDGVEKMLLNAMHEYACLILATDAFPSEAKQTQWAKATWQAACEEAGVHYECSVRMIRLVRLLLSLDRAEC